MFLLVVIIIYTSIFFYSFFYLGGDKNYLYFMFILFMFFVSIIILILSNSIFIIFLGWDGLGIRSFLLVNFFKNWVTLNNRTLTFLSNRVGDSLFLLYFSIILYSFNIFIIVRILFLLIISYTKRAQFPFISWLPAAMAAPTPVRALVHSSTLVTAGIFIILIFKFFSTYLYSKYIYLFSLLTLLISGLGAFLESDFKKIVAFSTLSQISLLFLIFSSFKFFLAFFHLFSHAFFKRILFINIGRILHLTNRCQERRTLNKKPPYLNYFLIIFRVFNLMGLFFLSGFWSKDLFLFYLILNNYIYNSYIFLYLIISLTFFYSLKILYFINNLNKNIYLINKSFIFIISFFLLYFSSIFFNLFFNINLYFYLEINLYSIYKFVIYYFIIMLIIILNIKYKGINILLFKKMGNLNIVNFYFSFKIKNFIKIIEKITVENNINLLLHFNYNNVYYFFIIMIIIFLIIL